RRSPRSPTTPSWSRTRRIPRDDALSEAEGPAQAARHPAVPSRPGPTSARRAVPAERAVAVAAPGRAAEEPRIAGADAPVGDRSPELQDDALRDGRDPQRLHATGPRRDPS